MTEGRDNRRGIPQGSLISLLLVTTAGKFFSVDALNSKTREAGV